MSVCKGNLYLIIRVYLYCLKSKTNLSKLAVNHFQTTEFHRNTSNCYLQFECVSAHIPWDAISNEELRRLYSALRSEFMLKFAVMRSSICWAEFRLSADIFKKHWVTRNEVSLSLDGWTSTNTLAVRLIIPYYMDCKWVSGEVQHTFHEGDRLYMFYFKS